MSSPTTPPEKGVPLGRILIILSVFAVPGLIYLGVRRLGNYVKIVDIPIAGEWQAPGQPWRIVFRPDKTLVSSTSPSQSGPGTYSVDYFGTLWVKLNNGKIYSAALATEYPTRFDLIDSDTLVPTVFEKVPPATPTPTPTPTPPDSAKESPG